MKIPQRFDCFSIFWYTLALAFTRINGQQECGYFQLPNDESSIDSASSIWPWQVRLMTIEEFPGDSGVHIGSCGGIVIDQSNILTAAHCWPSEDEQWQRMKIYLIVGQLDMRWPKKNEKLFRVKRNQILIHQNYENKTSLNDISVIQLPFQMKFGEGQFKNVRPICLPQNDGEPINNTDCFITGWGQTETNNSESTPTRLQQGRVKILENERCRQRFDEFNSQKQLCAGDLIGLPSESCDGDFVGPIQCRVTGSKNDWVLVGLTSFGTDICIGPAIYTKVEAFLVWIEVWKKLDEQGEIKKRGMGKGVSKRPKIKRPTWRGPNWKRVNRKDVFDDDDRGMIKGVSKRPSRRRGRRWKPDYIGKMDPKDYFDEDGDNDQNEAKKRNS